MRQSNALQLFLALSLGLLGTFAEGELVERSDWSRVFDRHQATGTIVIADERGESRADYAYNAKRATTRFSPASTFKVPHALFALDAGMIRDEFHLIPWDGTKRAHHAWNRDQNLRSSMRHSVVWVYEQFAKNLGAEQEGKYLKKIEYGNAAASGAEPFWINGDLAISATEQIAFLEKLYRNKLPFKVAHQRLVKDIMIVEAGPDWILRAKTGWSGKIGWWIGWVETSTGAVFFALNIDTPRRSKDLPNREAIPRAILSSLGALPRKSEERLQGVDHPASAVQSKPMGKDKTKSEPEGHSH